MYPRHRGRLGWWFAVGGGTTCARSSGIPTGQADAVGSILEAGWGTRGRWARAGLRAAGRIVGRLIGPPQSPQQETSWQGPLNNPISTSPPTRIHPCCLAGFASSSACRSPGTHQRRSRHPCSQGLLLPSSSTRVRGELARMLRAISGGSPNRP